MIVKLFDSVSENNMLLLSPPAYVNAPLLRFIFYANKFFCVKKILNCHIKSIADFNYCKQTRIFG